MTSANVSLLISRTARGAAATPKVSRPTFPWELPAVRAVTDAVALSAAGATAGGASPATWAYLGMTFVLLRLAPSRRRISLRLAPEMPNLLARLAIPVVLVAAFAAPSPVSLARTAAVAAILVIAGRAMVLAATRSARRRGRVAEPTVIVGAGRVGVTLASVCRDHPEYGLRPVGFVDDVDGRDLPLPLLGGVDSLERVIRQRQVRRVLVAFGARRDPDLVDVLRGCARAEVEVHVVPRLFELGLTAAAADTEDLWGIPVVYMRRAALRSKAWRVKRAVDVAVAGAALVLLAPVFGLIALGVRLSSRGPIFFRQRRVGQDGRPVEILKFRTLRVNADSDTTWNVSGDDRQTRLGKVLRKSSLDELPQLVNVVRGEMSLVGPRPERPHFVEEFSAQFAGYDARHRVPGGMTGWAQVHGLRGDTSIEERARFDNHYIENWSLWHDAVIVFRTFSAVVAELRSAGPKRSRPADVVVLPHPAIRVEAFEPELAA